MSYVESEPEFQIQASWPLAGRFLKIYSHVLQKHNQPELAEAALAASKQFEEYTTNLAEENSNT